MHFIHQIKQAQMAEDLLVHNQPRIGISEVAWFNLMVQYTQPKLYFLISRPAKTSKSPFSFCHCAFPYPSPPLFSKGVHLKTVSPSLHQHPCCSPIWLLKCS